jgi:hypothetical protein
MGNLFRKLKLSFKIYLKSFIFPFIQKDWIRKMWLFFTISYVPILDYIVIRGWRLQYVHNLGWKKENPLPEPKLLFKFTKNGILLWIMTGVYLTIPFILLRVLGWDGFVDLLKDIWTFLGLIWNIIIDGFNSSHYEELWKFIKTEFLHEILTLLVNTIFLIIYVPFYRIGMIRYALTNEILKSHLSIFKNIKFLVKNFFYIIMLYFLLLLKVIVILVVDIVLTATVIGIILIPIATVYMFYWNTGFEYGHLAQLMVEQEQLLKKDYKME